MSRTGFAIVVCLFMVSCKLHHHRENGENNVHAINCEDSIGVCYKAARETCPTGYEIDHIDNYQTPHDQDSFPITGLRAKLYPFIGRNAFTLLIACNTSGAKRSEERLKSDLAQQCIDECIATTAKSPDDCFDFCIDQIN